MARRILAVFCLPLLAGMAASALDLTAGGPDFANRFAEADRLVGEQRFAEAYESFTALAADYPDKYPVAVGRARSALLAGLHDAAKPLYERLLAEFPGDRAFREEYALILALQGEEGKAAAFLAEPAPDEIEASRRRAETMVRQAGAALAYERGFAAAARSPVPAAALRPERPLAAVYGGVAAGVLYDSNANQGPASEMFDLGNWRNIYVPGAKKLDAFGGYLGGNIGFRRFLSSGSPWAVVGDASLFVRANAENDLKRGYGREWQSGRASAGLAYADERNLLELRLAGQVFDYELNKRVLAFGPEINYLFAATPDIHLITVAGLNWRDYKDQSYRNGAYYQAGQHIRFLFGRDPARRHSFTVGGRYLGGDADEKNYRYDSWEAMASLNLRLPYRFTLSPNASATRQRYKGRATALETEKRRDTVWRIGAALRYDINDSWSVDAAYQYVDNDSNSSLYDYRQNVVSLGMSWRF